MLFFAGEDKGNLEDLEKKSLSSKTSHKGQSCHQNSSAILNMSNHRLYRSAVRPFFCCGSQFSLNSISEFIEIPNECTEETEYIDITDDEEEESDLMNALCIEDKGVTDRIVRRHSASRHKKSENGQDKGVMRKKFFTLKLRGRLHAPKSSRKTNEQVKDTNTSLESKKCHCTSNVPRTDAGASTSESLGATSPVETSHHESGVRQNAPWSHTDFILLSQRINQRINFDELYPTEDIDEQRIAQRAREMEEGIDVNDVWVHHSPLLGAVGGDLNTCHRSVSRTSSREDFYGELSHPQVRLK